MEEFNYKKRNYLDYQREERSQSEKDEKERENNKKIRKRENGKK